MGEVIDFQAKRAARQRARRDPVERLDQAVADLEAIIECKSHHPASRHLAASELKLINGAVSDGKIEEAARRAEQLADRLRPKPKHA